MKTNSRGAHLASSAVIVASAAILYGINPGVVLPYLLDFSVDSVNLANVFRAIMGLYLAFSAYWVAALWKPTLWRSATLSNVLFMGGLAFGRTLSLLFDGFSMPFFIGMVLELLFMLWGVLNLRKTHQA